MNQKKIQLIVLGDGAVGKTSLLKMYSDKQFTHDHKTTIGLDYVSKIYHSPKGENIQVKIWDTAGQERFHTITHTFYKQANGIIVAYDCTNEKSFQNVKTWISSIYQHADPNIVKVLAATKIDLKGERKVTYEQGKNIAEQNNMRFFETSAKENQNVEELMQYMTEAVYNKLFSDDEDRGTSIIISKQKPGASGGKGDKASKGSCCS